ncbi:unnamed protein product [Notodromas monacha]|uniref:Mitochondrial folate transporter/carrier n=1 Tax=Notodromas monacha TaxID=399045 RepID=A0A7R9GJL9_9CRUS|nr:unnamed protein product [Notodromas monacha]CAG0923815.1 unnamed protein product [Notodromas monacha]
MAFATMCLVMFFCCANVVALEFIMKLNPSSGNLITFVQFVFIAVEGFITTMQFGSRRPIIPLKRSISLVFVSFAVNVAGNWALNFNIAMPLHMIFKSGSLLANMLMNMVVLGRRYSTMKYVSVALVTAGILLCTLASAPGSSNEDASLTNWMIGVGLLTFSLLASAYLGIMQEGLYQQYPNAAKEVMFVAHAVPLPGFLLLYSDLRDRVSEFNESDVLWWCLLVNTLLQFCCLRSVYKLQTVCSSLTVTLVVTLRKFVSLVFSIFYFRNPFTSQHWAGAACVFFGVLLFADFFGWEGKQRITGLQTISDEKRLKREFPSGYLGLQSGYHCAGSGCLSFSFVVQNMWEVSDARFSSRHMVLCSSGRKCLLSVLLREREKIMIPSKEKQRSSRGARRFVILPPFCSSVHFERLFAGVSGGVASTLILHPLDVVKTRFAVDDGKTTSRAATKADGVFASLRMIVRGEGVSGLYRGVMPNVCTAGIGWGLYFYAYDSMKRWLKGPDCDQTKILSPGQHLVAAAWAGGLSLIALNPISVVKTRIIIQKQSPRALVASGGGGTTSVHYTNSLDAFLKIYKFEGLRGLYKVVRARMQDQYKSYSGLMDVVYKTFREEGLRGFYKGLVPNLMHVTPNICLVFLIYEQLTARVDK